MHVFEAKAYGMHETRNPLFPKRVNVSPRTWAIFSAFMGLSLVLGGLGVLVYAPYLEIQHVAIEGLTTLPPASVELTVREEFLKKRWGIVPNNHRWFFDTRSAEEALMAAYPLETVTIDREGPQLTVRLTEEISMIALRTGEEFVFLDRNGTILRTMTPEEKAAVLIRLGEASLPTGGTSNGVGELPLLQPDMPIIREKLATARVPGETVLDVARMENIMAFQRGLKTLQITPKEFVSDNLSLPWFAVTSDKDYLILFDAKKDVDDQLLVLKAVVDQHFATQSPGQYVDVRFGTRVFVR